MEITKTTPQAYINSLPAEESAAISKLDKLITRLAPAGSAHVMWEGKFWGGSEQRIIGYGSLTYVGSNKKEVQWFAVGLAMQKNYITIFVNAVQGKQYLAEIYKSRLGKVKAGKSSISFKKVEDVNLEVLEEVISKAFQLMNE